ncbi:hypothetical protein [Paraburkholderia sp. BL10I2N1]|uniref:hypothetical protein n=1 Tax=Paraburkholderia sp. BL10I2N1 TaxID=1938796 RepID=UPI00105E3841|nr:hypothetical protein [Paraburkholderia sp. BL10I2N1]
MSVSDKTDSAVEREGRMSALLKKLLSPCEHDAGRFIPFRRHILALISVHAQCFTTLAHRGWLTQDRRALFPLIQTYFDILFKSNAQSIPFNSSSLKREFMALKSCSTGCIPHNTLRSWK